MESIPSHHTPILIVDDDIGLLSSLEAVICSAGLPRPALVSEGERVMDILKTCHFQVILLDLVMPSSGGMDILEALKTEFPDVECIIITALDEVARAVQAMQFGAFDYLVKPIEKNKLLITIQRAIERYGFRHGLLSFADEPGFSDFKNPAAFDEIVCRDEKMIRVLHQTETAAVTDYNLVITGETGTGKELLARAIHRLSPRAKGPFMPVNMAAASKTLFEDSFFGHDRGAYTGALKSQKGFVETAQGGTLFLDEIGELDSDLQAKLLRVIEQKELCRLGSTDIKSIDVRIIAATNRNLHEEIREQRFRKDLFYRLTMLHIHIPPLRERKKDILPIAEYFLGIHNKKNNKSIKSMSPDLQHHLENHAFSGNVRELENMIASAVIAEKGEALSLSSACLLQGENSFFEDQPHPVNLLNPANPADRDKPLPTLREMEKQHILKTLEKTSGNRTHAAKMLGIGLRTLRRKINEYDQEGNGPF